MVKQDSIMVLSNHVLSLNLRCKQSQVISVKSSEQSKLWSVYPVQQHIQIHLLTTSIALPLVCKSLFTQRDNQVHSHPEHTAPGLLIHQNKCAFHRPASSPTALWPLHSPSACVQWAGSGLWSCQELSWQWLAEYGLKQDEKLKCSKTIAVGVMNTDVDRNNIQSSLVQRE